MSERPSDPRWPAGRSPAAGSDPEERARLAASFGGVAAHYQRYRPGPAPDAVDWVLPPGSRRVVDLGAGTGALSRVLVDRVDEVVAVEPDDRMRGVLESELPGVRAVRGRGEDMPLPDGWADAVVASSSWHWMDPHAALAEVSRVLVPGGTVAAVWSGPDLEGAFLVRARELLVERTRDARGSGTDAGDLANDGGGDHGDGAGTGWADAEIARVLEPGPADRSDRLEIPSGFPFGPPEHRRFGWSMALDADDLVGLLGTFSWVITLPSESRERLLTEARRLLGDFLGVEGGATVDVEFRTEAFRSRRS